ncbi:MAG TPA: tripartite tricarboxylate transporter TctB family protein [Thermodesulfobacteriota bacterium]
MMRRWERIAAAFLIFLGVGAAAIAYRLGFGTLHHPGSGFFPFWLSLVLAFVAFFYLLSRRGPDSEGVSLWSKELLLRPALAAGVMFLYALAMDWIGFFSSTFLLFLAWLILVERERWLTIGLVSILGTASLYLIFSLFLKVPLPKGSLF